MVNSKMWIVVASMMLSLAGYAGGNMLVPEGSVESEFEQIVPEIDSQEQWQGENDEEQWQGENDEEQWQGESEEEIEVEKKLVAIDAGHQLQGSSVLEPNGPGSSTMKARVTSGTTGRFTGIPEYVLVLEVALKLEQVLLDMGYDVLMIRSTHEVDISNAERAIMANEANADAFLRIHANGDNNATVEGAFTICMTANNPYNAQVYTESRLLTELVLDGFIEATGAKRRSIWETDTMTGINWCSVPSTIIEMGFMTNEKEDRLMATEEYQAQMVAGMAEGIRLYFEAMEQG